MAAPSCAYPLFRDRFWQREPLAGGSAAQPAGSGASGAAAQGGGSAVATAGAVDAGRESSPGKAASRMGSLRMLDLRTLPRDDGPPTELRARKEKLTFYERQCSRVAEGLYVGAEVVARSRDTLREAGITHVINCVGFLYPAHFEGDLAYQTLYLQDTPGEDLLCVLYDVFDFIEAATGGAGGGADGASSGRVLIHCSQGVSRSASLAIAYLMWKRGAVYDDMFLEVKSTRGVANPNIGFICQLLQWHKRRHAVGEAWRLYRIAPQSHAAPRYLVAKPVSSSASPRGASLAASLDPRGAFLLQGPSSLTLWVGSQCPEPFLAAAHRFAGQLHKYEAAAAPAAVVQQGEEPPAFWASLAAAGAGGCVSRSASPDTSGGARGTASASAAVQEMVAAAAEGRPPVVAENSMYDKDFELYHRSHTARTSADSQGGLSARSGGRKTPREEGDTATSPNDRLRKQARGEERPPSPGKRRREPPSDLTMENLQCVSMDSAAAQLGKKERTLQEASSPSPLGRTTSDMQTGSSREMELADGAGTPRSRGSEQQQQQQQHGTLQHGGAGGQRSRLPSNLGRMGSTASSAGGNAAAGGAAAGGAACGRRVPLLRLALPGR